MILNQANKVAGGAAVIRWISPLEGACLVVRYNIYYREAFSKANKGEWNLITIKSNVTSYTLHLPCWKEYEITVTSLNAYGEGDINDSKVWKFRTQGGNECF